MLLSTGRDSPGKAQLLFGEYFKGSFKASFKIWEFPKIRGTFFWGP